MLVQVYTTDLDVEHAVRRAVPELIEELIDSVIASIPVRAKGSGRVIGYSAAILWLTGQNLYAATPSGTYLIGSLSPEPEHPEQ